MGTLLPSNAEPAQSSSKPVYGECDKRVLLGALCPVRFGYDMLFPPAVRGTLRFVLSVIPRATPKSKPCKQRAVALGVLLVDSVTVQAWALRLNSVESAKKNFPERGPTDYPW